MKLEKRSEGADDATPAPEASPKGQKNKPVIVYIMILFIMAFLLMALSFFMHQRSNEEVIGTLQSSVSTLQELQESQDKIMRLQSQLTDANKKIETLQSQLDELNSTQSTGSDKTAALLALYTLQQEFSAKDSNACKQTIQAMEDAGQPALLSKDAIGDVVSPAERYQQLKEAVMSSE